MCSLSCREICHSNGPSLSEVVVVYLIIWLHVTKHAIQMPWMAPCWLLFMLQYSVLIRGVVSPSFPPSLELTYCTVYRIFLSFRGGAGTESRGVVLPSGGPARFPPVERQHGTTPYLQTKLSLWQWHLQYYTTEWHSRIRHYTDLLEWAIFARSCPADHAPGNMSEMVGCKQDTKKFWCPTPEEARQQQNIFFSVF